MPWFDVFWTDTALEHLAEHGVTQDEFEEVIFAARVFDQSDSSGRPLADGYTSTGRRIVCVFEYIDNITILPITAYSPEEA